MTDKNKDEEWKKEYEDIKNEILMERVSRAIKTNPESWQYELEELGFAWVNDDDTDEINEEKRATPANKNQENLVGYFEGETKLTEKLIQVFIKEVEAEEPNYPLFRKYFKSGNKNLLQLLLEGLSSSPTNLTLLSGMDYYHENNNVLSIVIQVYLMACKECVVTTQFKEIALDFAITTSPQGYDAIEELKAIYINNQSKLNILEEVKNILYRNDEDIIF